MSEKCKEVEKNLNRAIQSYKDMKAEYKSLDDKWNHQQAKVAGLYKRKFTKAQEIAYEEAEIEQIAIEEEKRKVSNVLNHIATKIADATLELDECKSKR